MKSMRSPYIPPAVTPIMGSTITKPTLNKEEVLEGINKIENRSTESGTNIQKGLIEAEEIFSENGIMLNVYVRK